MFSKEELKDVEDWPGDNKHLKFTEFDENATRTIKEYLETSPYKVTKELEIRVCDCILKYLLLNISPSPEHATETAISERLGIPRSKLRRLLGLLEWEEIVEPKPVGATQPYVVKDISKAFKKGYLSFSKIEAQKLTRIVGHTGKEVYHPFLTLLRAIHSTIPNEMELYAIQSWMGEIVKPIVQVQRPLYYDKEISAKVVSSTYPLWTDRELVQEFVDYSLGLTFSTPVIREVLFELGLPERITKEQFHEGLKQVGEKYLKLMLRLVEPLAKVIEEKGFNGASLAIKKTIYKEEIIAAHPKHISMSGDLVFDTPVSDPKLGYIGLQTQPLTLQHIRFVSNFLRAAARFASQAKADQVLIETTEMTADMLEYAAENDYKGMKEEGLSLQEWFKKNQQRS